MTTLFFKICCREILLWSFFMGMSGAKELSRNQEINQSKPKALKPSLKKLLVKF
jgi:hypothetical protein